MHYNIHKKKNTRKTLGLLKPLIQKHNWILKRKTVYLKKNYVNTLVYYWGIKNMVVSFSGKPNYSERTKFSDMK